MFSFAFLRNAVRCRRCFQSQAVKKTPTCKCSQLLAPLSKRTQTHTDTHTRTDTHTHTRTDTHTHTYTHTAMHIDTHIDTHTAMHMLKTCQPQVTVLWTVASQHLFSQAATLIASSTTCANPRLRVCFSSHCTAAPSPPHDLIDTSQQDSNETSTFPTNVQTEKHANRLTSLFNPVLKYTTLNS